MAYGNSFILNQYTKGCGDPDGLSSQAKSVTVNSEKIIGTNRTKHDKIFADKAKKQKNTPR